ncbi:MAG: hypothetical protein QOD41_2520 [Cryptosporangiaceae bacterium]|nr:hypothetical protein [Cryptosporangiaceae bacterium]
MTSDDAYWRRPAEGSAQPAPPVREPSGQPAYAGPPRTVRPGPHSAPVPLIQQLPPPRALPPQDHAAIDAAEREATVVTYAVAIAIGVLTALLILVVVIRQVAT